MIADWVSLVRAFTQLEFASMAQYRANLALWLVSTITEPIIFLVVWINVARTQGGSVGGYDEHDIAAYYLLVMFMRQATSGISPGRQAYRIRSGDMNFVLLHPVHPIFGDMSNVISWRLTTIAPLIPAMLVIGLAFGARLHPPLWAVITFIPVVLIIGVARFLLQYIITIMGFWTDRVEGIFSIYWTVQTFLGGILAPLALLPPAIRAAADFLPFRWFFAFPVDLMLGRLSVGETVIGLAALLGWSLVGAVIVALGWREGIKRYGAFGG